jgi:FtsH-binding integral membrane protein
MKIQRSIALYRHLSALYPKSFRAEYGRDLVATFTEHLRDERSSRVWLSTVRDLVVTVPSLHLEARMNRRPAPQTTAVLATGVTIAALVLAIVAGTGPVVGVFLLIAIIALVVATLAWKAAIAPRDAEGVASHWRAILIVGVALLATVLVVINVPPYNNRDLPEAGWVLMMLSLVTSIGLITVGLTMGIAHRSNHRRTS